jgi:hypothetical protein
MINIIITQYKSDKWFSIQKEYIEKYTSGDYRILCGNYEIDMACDDHRYSFHNISSMVDSHYTQVNLLAYEVLLPKLSDEDIFIFMDCDTLPCEYGWDLKIKEYLNPNENKQNDIVAVVMRENKQPSEMYDNLPHLCFFATTKKVWLDNSLHWHLAGSENPQVGMKNLIAEKNLTLKELNRTNVFNAHNVLFGVYDNLIYHHCCAIRGFWPEELAGGRGEATEGSDYNLRKCPFTSDLNKVNVDIWHSVFDAIDNDKERTFVRRYFMGENG